MHAGRVKSRAPRSRGDPERRRWIRPRDARRRNPSPPRRLLMADVKPPTQVVGAPFQTRSRAPPLDPVLMTPASTNRRRNLPPRRLPARFSCLLSIFEFVPFPGLIHCGSPRCSSLFSLMYWQSVCWFLRRLIDITDNL